MRLSEFCCVYRAASALTSTGVNLEAQTEVSSHLECIDNHGA
jgi:hypothetical protein